jgi:hypothetical protein
MGLDVNGVRFLLYCKALGVDFTKTATIGRQGLHLSEQSLGRVFETFGYQFDAQEIESMMTQSNGYAEHLLKGLGAVQVNSFDNSEYEGATYIHDMNQELPVRFIGQYTTVFDGGSLEHIFNFPTALKNCMEMISVGGHYLALTPGNNLLGHGFYQFSPELYFSVFTEDNGFALIDVIAFEYKPHVKWNARWYSVKSPLDVRGRVELTNSDRVNLLVLARKVAPAKIFRTIPQQSDYLAMWHSAGTSSNSGPGNISLSTAKQPGHFQFLKRRIPTRVKKKIRQVLSALDSRPSDPFDPRFFRPMDPAAAGGRILDKSLQRTS